ncbi:hypothetical protein H6A00_16190 [Bacillus licheniformis]|nr:hypothetical protein [Bacillus licheniformis]
MNSQKGDEERLYLTELDMFCVHFGSRIYSLLLNQFFRFPYKQSVEPVKGQEKSTGI